MKVPAVYVQQGTPQHLFGEVKLHGDAAIISRIQSVDYQSKAAPSAGAFTKKPLSQFRKFLFCFGVGSRYDGARSCAILNAVAAGASDCSYGCLGQGDCVDACRFGALHIDPLTGLPTVDEDKCTGCGACVKSCPRTLIELRPKGPKGRRVYVSCANRERGALAIKECKVSCIGCGKCARTCPFGAIAVTDNLAYIDPNLCKLCRKCVAECPTKAIHAVNFPTPLPTKTPQNQDRQ